MESDPSRLRYFEVTRKLNQVTIIGATAISVALVASFWGQWRAVGILAGAQLFLVVFNTWTNTRLLGRYGMKAELVRTVVNMGMSVVLLALVGWSLAFWLWLPYVALSFDQLGRRFALGVLVAICATFDLAALVTHQPLMLPVIFTSLAAYCWAISGARHGVIRDMLTQSDRQREQLKREVAARERVELELRQAQKLEAVGRLAAGVAHEINTPVQFVSDSVQFLRTAVAEILDFITKSPTCREAVEANARLPYLLENMPGAADLAIEGLERIATIVRSMKRFAHPEQEGMRSVDLNEALESTLVISAHEYKLVADLETEFAVLPLVTCSPGEINQVLLNLVVNAAHAVEDVVGNSGARGKIKVSTRHEGDDVLITISDTGAGIPPEARSHIFEPFFTTKKVGRGTGQGLAIARSVIERHAGSITFETESGKGTTFRIRLPVSAPAELGVFDGQLRALQAGPAPAQAANAVDVT